MISHDTEDLVLKWLTILSIVAVAVVTGIIGWRFFVAWEDRDLTNMVGYGIAFLILLQCGRSK